MSGCPRCRSAVLTKRTHFGMAGELDADSTKRSHLGWEGTRRALRPPVRGRVAARKNAAAPLDGGPIGEVGRSLGEAIDLGVDAGLEGVETGDGFAGQGAGAGGLLSVSATCFDLAVGVHGLLLPITHLAGELVRVG